MKRTEALVEISGSVWVSEDETGALDPENNAIEHARRVMNTPYSPDVERYGYDAHREGDGYRVVINGHASAAVFGPDADVKGAAASVDRGTFDEKRVLEWSVMDVAEVVAQRHTVSDLRELGREHDVSYERGSRKDELAEQFVEQAPAAARGLV